jgi:hypothetical protein
MYFPIKRLGEIHRAIDHLQIPPHPIQTAPIGALLYFCDLYKESVLDLQKIFFFSVLDRGVGGRQGVHSREILSLYMVASKVYLANKYRTGIPPFFGIPASQK